MPACLLGTAELVTAATDYPVTVEDVREHCRVDINDDDGKLMAFIDAATSYCQRFLDRQLMTATFDIRLRGWWSGEQFLPRPPLQSITSVKYYDTSGTLTTLSSAYYVVRTPTYGPGSIELAPDYVWPTFQSREYPVVVRIVAGYSSAAAVPESTKNAIYMLIDYFNENRGNLAQPIPKAIDALLAMDSWGSCV